MNKLPKILVAAEFILITAIIALALIDDKEVTGYVVLGNASIEKTDFKVFTKAVCEEKDEHIFCRDKLFVKCNDQEYMIREENSDIIECNNIKLNLSDAKVKGDGIFQKDGIMLP
ncbi:MAG: hypothetical protein HYS80_02695 [Candidatus Aenigmarchaeota archaeon]|nr:hypothetical protein [Candidatus Aenigmarchaeota archaeon]